MSDFCVWRLACAIYPALHNRSAGLKPASAALLPAPFQGSRLPNAWESTSAASTVSPPEHTLPYTSCDVFQRLHLASIPSHTFGHASHSIPPTSHPPRLHLSPLLSHHLAPGMSCAPLLLPRPNTFCRCLHHRLFADRLLDPGLLRQPASHRCLLLCRQRQHRVWPEHCGREGPQVGAAIGHLLFPHPHESRDCQHPGCCHSHLVFREAVSRNKWVLPLLNCIFAFTLMPR